MDTLTPNQPEHVAAAARLIALLTNTHDVLEFASGAVLVGDCLHRLRQMPDGSVDSVVTDPPYEISFMGKGWDGSGIAYNVEVWAECLRVLKPGGHLLAFGATRTYHRMTVAIEDAGFEIRDSLHWLYGSGFPKSMDVSKAIEKAAGAEREVVGIDAAACEWIERGEACPGHNDKNGRYGETVHAVATAPATDAARQWEGWGTALKPAHEPIVVARKPLVATVAANVLAHGTGALNIDRCRVGSADTRRPSGPDSGHARPFAGSQGGVRGSTAGRWPANLVLTHAAECDEVCAPGCPVAELDGQSGVSGGGERRKARPGKAKPLDAGKGWNTHNMTRDGATAPESYGDTGGASRFFIVTEWDPIADVAPFRYVAKPSKRERNAGLDGLPAHTAGEVTDRKDGSAGLNSPRAGAGRTSGGRNIHPTVKPVALMRWLVRLVTPPGGTALDPFAGSGTTLVAATLEGFQFIGCEMTPDYLPIIAGRVRWAEGEPPSRL